MRKYRLIYAFWVVAATAAVFVFSSRYMLILVAAVILITLLSQIMIVCEAKGITVRMNVKNTCTVGSTATVEIILGQPRRLFASSMLTLELKYRNPLLDVGKTEKIKINLHSGKNSVITRQSFTLCGEVKIECVKLRCCGVFGVTGVKLPCTAQALLTVNPARIPLDIDCGETGSRCPNGEKYRKNRSGADLSEVHDLREYRDGDDMRMIHWKLSEKLVSPIVRDPSEPSKFYLLLLLDAGLYIGEKKLDSREVSAAVELFIAISERLVSLGVSHYVGITSDRLCYLPVTDRLSFCEMRSRLLCMVLPKQAGTAMKHFSVSDRRREFSKLLFVCSDSFDGEAERFCGEMSVTGICVSAEGESSAIVENNSEMIKISEKSVYGQTHRITI